MPSFHCPFINGSIPDRLSPFTETIELNPDLDWSIDSIDASVLPLENAFYISQFTTNHSTSDAVAGNFLSEAVFKFLLSTLQARLNSAHTSPLVLSVPLCTSACLALTVDTLTVYRHFAFFPLPKNYDDIIDIYTTITFNLLYSSVFFGSGFNLVNNKTQRITNTLFSPLSLIDRS
ncbi:hypothetical protein GEMRC1_006081 [Eukaryota sp. GEM-RC1]